MAKYDSYCEGAMKALDAEGILFIVLNGKRGSGFSASFRQTELQLKVPSLLRKVADDIERDLISGAKH
jgi:hypothetical protein